MSADLSYLDENTQDIGTALSEVMRLVEALTHAQQRVEEAENLLSNCKKEERRLREEVIPSYMKQHQLEELTLENGVKVSIVDELAISVPADEKKREILFSFLLDNEGGDLIKEKVEFEDADDEVINLLQTKGITFNRSSTVNTLSLKAWMKRALGMTKGSIARLSLSDVPSELNLYLYSNTKVTTKK